MARVLREFAGTVQVPTDTLLPAVPLVPILVPTKARPPTNLVEFLQTQNITQDIIPSPLWKWFYSLPWEGATKGLGLNLAYLFRGGSPQEQSENMLWLSQHQHLTVPELLFEMPLMKAEQERYQRELESSRYKPKAVASTFTCPRCGGDKVLSSMQQTRSADEPMTIHNTCLDCGHKWKR